jgi:hypothetical protein
MLLNSVTLEMKAAEMTMFNFQAMDAIKEHIIPKTVTKAQAQIVYASEADILNTGKITFPEEQI